jgi:hypothetical protein
MSNPCTECGYLNVSTLLKERLGPKLPDGIHFFDFGDGRISMPVWNGNTYLTKNLAVLAKLEVDGLRVLPFHHPGSVSHQRPDDHIKTVLECAERALAHWDTESRVIKEGDRLPPAVDV